MEKWTVCAKRADFNAIAKKFNIDPVVARIIRNRDIIGESAIDEYLNADLRALYDPFLMTDMQKAADIIRGKISDGAAIRVIGDYDIDGVMAAFILKQGLSALGGRVDARIPDRRTDGYGISERLITDAADEGIDTIITCDNGIGAVREIALAKRFGMTVIVTDHHDAGEEIPACDAVVDPCRAGDKYPNKDLCGAAVAWKLILAMGGDPEMRFLPYAAFATIGDIMTLLGENRTIVKEGLKALRKTDNVGLLALARACRTDISRVNPYTIGFVLGPCINASGRLDSAERALDLLEAENEKTADRIAGDLRALNESRKNMTDQGLLGAQQAIEKEGLAGDDVLVVFLPDTDESVAGIIAGRLRERTGHPAFVLTRGTDCVKGSGRSIPTYPMYEKLSEVSDLLLKFGGHPMAAGFSIEEKNIPEFRKRLNAHSGLSADDLIPHVRIDVCMPLTYVSERFIEALAVLEPYGKGNENPVFAQKHVLCEHPRLFGAKRNVLKMRVRQLAAPGDQDPARPGFQAAPEGPAYDAVCFNRAQELFARVMDDPDVAITYEPRINEYLGRRRIEIVITHFQ